MVTRRKRFTIGNRQERRPPHGSDGLRPSDKWKRENPRVRPKYEPVIRNNQVRPGAGSCRVWRPGIARSVTGLVCLWSLRRSTATSTPPVCLRVWNAGMAETICTSSPSAAIVGSRRKLTLRPEAPAQLWCRRLKPALELNKPAYPGLTPWANFCSALAGLGRSGFARPSHRKAESIPYDGQQIPRGLKAAGDDNNLKRVDGRGA